MDQKRIRGLLYRHFGFGLLLIALIFPAFADMAAAKRAYEDEDYAKAFKEFLRLAEEGSAYAQSAVAYMYYAGQGVAKNDGEAARWCHKAADQGELAVQWVGIETPKLRAAITPDSFLAWARIDEGKGVPKDYEEIAKWYRSAAAQGDADAQYGLGILYETGEGVPYIPAECLKWYRLAAAQGNVAALLSLALKLGGGEEAAKWYRPAANQGVPWAQYRLGWLYLVGAGVPRDYAEAVRWLRASAGGGYFAAQAELGSSLDDVCGSRVPADSKGQALTCDSAEAAEWYGRAAARGHPESQEALGEMYLQGRGVPQSDAAALKWLRLAADQGKPGAQLDLARMYKDGRGTPQNYILAHMWANLAASRYTDLPGWHSLSPENQSGMRRYYTALRDELAGMMTPEQVAEAQALARDWKPTKPGDASGSQAPRDSAPAAGEQQVFAGPNRCGI